MGINEQKCDACGADLDADNCYYVYLGRLQQGPMSAKGNTEYNLCGNCYNQIKAEVIVSVQRRKNQR
jgi:hypothetical protein